MLVAAIAVGGAGAGLAAADEATDAPCADRVSDSAPLARLPEPPACRPGRADHPKRPKGYPAAGPLARGNGLVEPLTTLYSVHTREALPFFRRSRPPAEMLRRFFRCRGFGFEVDLDPRLIDQVLETAEHFECARVEVISGYRSPKFNDALMKKGRHVAANSRHTRGEALDVRFVGTPAAAVGRYLWEQFDGGVGTDRKSVV